MALRPAANPTLVVYPGEVGKASTSGGAEAHPPDVPIGSFSAIPAYDNVAAQILRRQPADW
jgi:hypothetical protein